VTPSWEICEGDALAHLRSMHDEAVHCCVTSPPYFGLRDYDVDGQIGLEDSPEEFLAALVEVFREVRRALRSDGTLWLNLGDSYNADGRKGRAHMGRGKNSAYSAWVNKTMDGTKPKDLMGMPWLLAFALRADGWWLRSEIVWSKPNPMPESVTDRPTRSHEHLFLLSRSSRYYYDADAIREPDKGLDHARTVLSGQPSLSASVGAPHAGIRTPEGRDGLGRNKRSVWEIATDPYPGAHFATFPRKLVEPCILAGTSERTCGECGAPWERLTAVEYENPGNRTTNGPRSIERRHLEQGSAGYGQRLERRARTVGWEPGCEHSDNRGHAVVLDPFAGAGTTGLVALRHGRSFVGIELSPVYSEMARERIRGDAPLMNTAAEVAA
jgi:DNA modification methylase